MKNKYSLQYFLLKPWSFVLIGDDKIIFKSKAQRLQPLIFCVKKYKKEMRGAVVFDKIVGRAAAYLLTHAKVAEVWTPVISKDAKKILTEKNIKIAYGQEVACIRNGKGNDLCPMEKLSRKMGKKIVKKLLS